MVEDHEDRTAVTKLLAVGSRQAPALITKHADDGVDLGQGPVEALDLDGVPVGAGAIEPAGDPAADPVGTRGGALGLGLGRLDGGAPIDLCVGGGGGEGAEEPGSRQEG